MSSSPERIAGYRTLPLPIRPWTLLLIGAGLILAGLLVALVPGNGLVPVRLSLLLAGLIVSGASVWLRLGTASINPQDALPAAGFVALAGVAPILASLGLSPSWDSAALLLYVLASIAFAGAVLLLLSPWMRRLVLSLLVLFHFCGIFVATTAVPARGEPIPWWTQQLWARVYDDYLHFSYLVNAYHFYSPDPGPPNLLWFRIQYADGSYRWVKTPRREDFGTRLEFQRRLGLTEAANDLLPTWPLIYLQRLPNRQLAGMALRLPVDEANCGPAPSQYRELSPQARVYLQSFARHIAHGYPNEKNPELPIVGLKVYRVTHNMLTARELHEGQDPLDPRLYEAYFLGEFDADGQLKKDDGFRYWRLPIRWIPLEEVKLFPDRYPIVKDPEIKEFESRGGRKDKAKQVLLDGVRVHAGDPLELHPENLK